MRKIVVTIVVMLGLMISGCGQQIEKGTKDKEEIQRLGWKKSYSALSEIEKVQLRYNIIMRSTSDAQGDALRTAGSYANQMKQLQSTLTNLKQEIGEGLLPALTELVKVLNEAAKVWTITIKYTRGEIEKGEWDKWIMSAASVSPVGIIAMKPAIEAQIRADKIGGGATVEEIRAKKIGQGEVRARAEALEQISESRRGVEEFAKDIVQFSELLRSLPNEINIPRIMAEEAEAAIKDAEEFARAYEEAIRPLTEEEQNEMSCN